MADSNSDLIDLILPSLAAVLTCAEAGHKVRSIGTHERLMPITETLKEHGRTNTITRQQVGVGVVNVFQFDLPVIHTDKAI